MCLYPKFILNRKYVPNKKNGGNPPTMKDERTKYVPVGCGKCMECMKQKAMRWQVRLHEEIRVNPRADYVTLSFSEESLIKLDNKINSGKDKITGYNLDNKMAILGVRLFLERWRKQFKTSLKHWLVTELGHVNTERIHIHGLIWPDYPREYVTKIWQYGNVWFGDYVNEKTINYIIKYINKQDEDHKYYTPVILTSPGIGSGYLKRVDKERNKFRGKDTIEYYTTRNGIKLPLPIYSIS